MLRPGHRDGEALGLLEDWLRVGLAVVAIPERMPDAVAAFDLNCRAKPAAVLALTLGLNTQNVLLESSSTPRQERWLIKDRS